MRRKVTLYIADRKVDLDDQSFILFNYTQEDLSNPTIVKNSYTQQIRIKGTPNNNAIFGDAFRLDRRVANAGGNSGVDYNPFSKTPFAIYNEMNEILESGYAKLDAITRKGKGIEYKVTLYGGLGAFLYALAYDDNGNKRTLADLHYMPDKESATELDLKINRNAVKAAWATENTGPIDNIWKVINFAPAYNGIPAGDFDAKKGLVNPVSVGLQPQITTDEGETYSTREGYTLVSLANAQDEWATKDLRSYLQRPIVSMRAIINAIAMPENNGGYAFDKSSIDSFTYNNLWMTLPLIPSLGSFRQSSSATLSLSAPPTNLVPMATYTLDGNIPAGTKVSTILHCKYNVNIGANRGTTLYRFAEYDDGSTIYTRDCALIMQVVAYSARGTMVGGSNVQVYKSDYMPLSVITNLGRYTPIWQDESTAYEVYNDNSFTHKGNGIYEFGKELTFSVDAYDVSYYKVFVLAQTYNSASTNRPAEGDYSLITNDTCLATLSKEDYNSYYESIWCKIEQGSANVVNYATADTLRSNAQITKKILLSTAASPADYLLSFCKIFGFSMVYNSAQRSVKVVRRNELYIDETIDLSKRIDLSKDVSIIPFSFDAKWYSFSLAGAGGAFYDEYEQVQGRPYGCQRVNTGYEFNSETRELLNDNVFKNACTILDRSKYYNNITYNGKFIPSPFLDKGNKYTLWSAAGKTLDTEISCPPYTASVSYWNGDTYKGYDQLDAKKVQLCDKDRKGVDGENILLIYNNTSYYPSIQLTDDLPAMDLLNDGVPCWLLGGAEGGGVSIPVYNRYQFNGYDIVQSLDFGVPKELDIPSVNYPEEVTIYEQYWKAYLQDRYDINTKVVKCKVNLAGLQVNADSLRRFYWFENSLWVLNAIKNYSLTTFDPVECEFIQVQNKENYINGQEKWQKKQSRY